MGDDPSRCQTRVFGADRLAFVVDSSDQNICALVEELFGDLPNLEVREPRRFTLDRVEAREGSGWALGGLGSREQRTESLPAALALLLAAVNVGALDSSPAHLHLHAGAAARDGRAAVIAAPRGTGKTTTVATLARRGWSFITDENVVLSADDDWIRGIPRPLSIKPDGRAHVSFLQPYLSPPAAGADELAFVPVGSIGTAICERAAAGLVVLLDRRGHRGDAAHLHLHPADAVVGLMQQTLDAGRFGAGAILRLAQLAVASTCVRVLAGSPDSTAQLIEELIEAPIASPGPLAARPMIRNEIATVMVGDRAVVHDTTTGTVVALDQQGSRVWERLAGWCTNDDVDLGEPQTAVFVRRLGSLGLVEDPP